jgi:hypothetical protein
MNTQTQEIVTSFNDLFCDLLRNIAKIDPESLVGKHLVKILTTVRDDPIKVIEIFVIHILPYKDEIDEGNDKFFISQRYDGKGEIKADVMVESLEFKKLWGKLVPANKQIIIQYMKILAQYTQQYFVMCYT